MPGSLSSSGALGRNRSPRVQSRPIRLGISSCLLQERVHYDGGHQLDRYPVHTLGRYAEWVPVWAYLAPYPKERMLRNHV